MRPAKRLRLGVVGALTLAAAGCASQPQVEVGGCVDRLEGETVAAVDCDDPEAEFEITGTAARPSECGAGETAVSVERSEELYCAKPRG